MMHDTMEAIQKVDVGIAGFHLIGMAGTIKTRTQEAPDFVDITDQVARMVQDAHVTLGFVVVFSKHTTTAVVINEKETGLMKDVTAFLERLAPRHAYYTHNDFDVRTENMTPDEIPNGHAHLQNWILCSSQTIPVLGGKMGLGTWQRIFFVELDSPRDREVIVQIFGVSGGNGHHGGVK